MTETDGDELVTSELFFHGESQKAIKVSIKGDEAGGFWLPKSQIDIERLTRGKVRFTWPMWLAKERGLW